MKFFLTGIKGSGMSALAIVLKDLGNDVKGSDYESYIFTQDELDKHNIVVNDFSIDNIDDIELLIVGHNFIDSDNIEILEAKRRGIEIIEYHKFISEFIKDYYSIAVSGSNGKSTTTALISLILNEVENTSFLVGSGEGRGNKSKYFTFEACEYKEHFLEYKPSLILVNNIDYDHVDYYKSEDDYKSAFYKFIENAKDKVVVNGDDINLKYIKNTIVFGIYNRTMFNARNISYENGIKYDLYYKDEYIDKIELEMYGECMVYNTLASICVCMSLGISIEIIKRGLKKFKGVKRRFMETIIDDDVYIDDYAHHPSKIRAIIDAVKSKYKDRKVIAFFRPDRISRLDYFSSSFLASLKRADEFYVLPFISNTKEENESYLKFINDHNLEKINDDVYSRVSKQRGVVYLMMSSKSMEEVKENLLKYKG